MSDPVLHKMQRFPVIYPAKAAFKTGGTENAQAGATAKLQFTLDNNPHEITGLRIRNVYEIPDAYMQSPQLASSNFLERKDGEQDLVMRMTQQNVVLDECNQVTVVGNDGIHWHPFELPYPFRGGNKITVDVNRVTGYRFVNGNGDEILINNVTVTAAIVGWMYVGPRGVLPGPPSTDFEQFLNERG